MESARLAGDLAYPDCRFSVGCADDDRGRGRRLGIGMAERTACVANGIRAKMG